MKKTMKSIIAATLALVMLLCSVPAFAAEPAETVKWYWWEDNYHEYHYEGELKEGTVEFDKDTPEFIYYTFEAQEEGYYLMSLENEWLGAIMPEEIKNGCFYGEIYSDEHIGKIAGTDSFATLWHVEKGEYIIGFFVGGGTGSPSTIAECGGFSIEYCGKEVTDLSFEESSLENLILDCDLRFDEYSGKENAYYMFDIDGVEITFDAGKVVAVDDNGYSLISKNTIKEGTNDFTVTFLGYEEDISVTAYDLAHFVKSAELSNPEKYTDIKMFYNGDYQYNDDFSGETVMITLADDSKITCELDEFGYAKITLDNGREYFIDVYYSFNWTECDLYISFDYYGDTLGKYECNVEQASVKENSEALKNNIEHGTYWEISRIKYAICDIFESASALELMDSINDFISIFIGNATAILGYVSSELVMFLI